jgi:quercetin dioxygenase-like cupin family protein
MITIEQAKEQLQKEGFPIIYEWKDEPATVYEKHYHKGRVSFYVIDGSVTFSGGIEKTISKGERVDVPIGVEHSAIVGENGCFYIVGQDIEGDA